MVMIEVLIYLYCFIQIVIQIKKLVSDMFYLECLTYD